MRYLLVALCSACASSPPPPPAPPAPAGEPVPQDPLWNTVQARVGTEQMWTEIVTHGPRGEELCSRLVKATLDRRPGDKVLASCHRGGGGRWFPGMHHEPRKPAQLQVVLEDPHPAVTLPAEVRGADVGYADYTLELDGETCHAHRRPGQVCLQTDVENDISIEIDAEPQVLVPGDQANR